MNQKARRIGMGMKPRAAEEANLPTTEGREELLSDPIPEQITAAVGGGDLESVSAGPSEEVPEEVPESAEKELELHATEVPEEAFDALAAVMKASEGESGVQNLESPGESISDAPMWFNAARAAAAEDEELDALAEKMLPEMMEGVNDPLVDVGQEFPVTSKDGNTTVYKMPFKPEPPRAEDFIVTKSGRRKLAEMELGMGLLATGEYRHTVRIAESYVEGAKQQAEADGVPLEDWLTIQLHSYLEQYWWAKGPK